MSGRVRGRTPVYYSYACSVQVRGRTPPYICGGVWLQGGSAVCEMHLEVGGILSGGCDAAGGMGAWKEGSRKGSGRPVFVVTVWLLRGPLVGVLGGIPLTMTMGAYAYSMAPAGWLLLLRMR